MSVEKANRTWHAGKPKKKPDYDREEITEELLAAVVGVYEALDEYGNHPSLQAIVDELDCGLNPLKVRKLLITAGEVQGKKIYESACNQGNFIFQHFTDTPFSLHPDLLFSQHVMLLHFC